MSVYGVMDHHNLGGNASPTHASNTEVQDTSGKFFIFVFDESCLNKNKDMQCKRQQSKKRLKNALLFSDNYQSTIHKYIRQEDSGERFVARKKNVREERRPNCLE